MTPDRKQTTGRLHQIITRLLPMVVDLWIGAVLVTFLVIRILGSNSAAHALHKLFSH